MKLRRVIAMTIILTLLAYLLVAFSPVSANKSYAAVAAGTLSRDINGIDDSLYPGYKSAINNLKAAHPNYTFLVYYTGLNWSEALVAEFQGHDYSPMNLVQRNNNYDGRWICPLCGTKNYDNGSWCCASMEALAYMMDPRTSINEEDIFQFKDLEGADVSYNSIAQVVAKYGAYINNPEAIQAIYDASVQYNINGFFLVAKIINEHGANGSTLSNGTNGVYNYFNIGSFGNSKDAIIANGLSYAASQGWTSIRASILGGAAVVRESYMTKYSQNTFYYQKFNVSGRSTLASHQYQQNIMAAQSQGTSYKSYYTQVGAINNEVTFIIPLYLGMPSNPCARPDVTKANSLTYENGTVQVGSTLNVRASAAGTAIGKLNNGEAIKIINRGTTKINDHFWDVVVSKANGTYGYVAREYIVGSGENGSTVGSAVQPTPQPETPAQPTQPTQQPQQDPAQHTNCNTIENDSNMKTSDTYLVMVPNVSVETIKNKCLNIVVKDKNGTSVSSGKIGTGFKVSLGEKTYTVVKKGDVDGDGNVTVIDAVKILNAVKGTATLSNEYAQAACTKNGNTFTVADVVQLLNSIKGTVSLNI